MSDDEIKGVANIAHEIGVSKRTALRIVKKAELKTYKYGKNSSLLRCKKSDIDSYIRRKRGE